MTSSSRMLWRHAALLVAALTLMPVTLPAQKPLKKAAAADPKLKGIWEPVSYPADIEFTDVYFVTADVGWAAGHSRSDAGEGGVILHTKDGGTTWSVQLGDPESATRGFLAMQFIDAHHGWVAQFGGKILRTTDGESWETMGDWSYGNPYRFISPQTGFGVHAGTIHRTDDGGRSWKPIYQCQLTIQVEGLTRAEGCDLEALHFPTTRVGYALSRELTNGASAILKTEDGGASWNPFSFLPDASGKEGAIHFFNETNGLIRTYSKIFLTSDGGRTWRSVPATVPGGSPAVRFADPDVGWTIGYKLFTYTTDGGKRWNSRETPFPDHVNAFSLPRRDRGYIVGSHGMIYRYRLVPAAEALAAKVIAAPAMPLFDSPLDDQVDALAPIVDALEQAVASAPDSAAGAASSAAASEDAEFSETEPSEEDLSAAEADQPEMSAFTASCCTKPLGKFDLVLIAVTGLVPQFLGQYKNTNLLVAGLRMLSDLPGSVTQLNNALRAFRKAPDKAAAQAALAQVSTAIQGLTQSTAVAFQEPPPPQVEESGEAGATAVEGGVAEDLETGQADDAEMVPPEDPEATPPDAVEEPPADEYGTPAEEESDSGPAEQSSAGAPSDDGIVAEAARVAEEEAKKTAKESVGKSIKKKLRF